MINTDYCYCSGIGCKIRDKCKRYLTNPPDIPLWWIDAAYNDRLKSCPLIILKVEPRKGFLCQEYFN